MRRIPELRWSGHQSAAQGEGGNKRPATDSGVGMGASRNEARRGGGVPRDLWARERLCAMRGATWSSRGKTETLSVWEDFAWSAVEMSCVCLQQEWELGMAN